MYRKTVTTILLVIFSCTSLAWAEPPEYYLIPGREKLFNGTLSGVRQAYQIFTNGINDPNASSNSELRFFHAAAGTAMLAIRDDGGSINSFFELASEFGIDVLGDNWHQLYTYHPVNEHDAYEIPAGAPDADQIRSIFDTSMIPDVNSLIADLDSISDSPPFRIFLDPNETRIFDPNSPELLFDVEVDYAEVLLLKGLLMALKGQLQARSAYDMYVDPNDNLVEKLHSNSFNMNTDLLNPYPNLLKVAPTTNNPDNGATILAQARQDLIDAIDYYFDAINYIRNETDDQEDDFLYIDPNDEYGLAVTDDRLTTLRNSLANDTVGTYPWETARTYTIKDIGGTPIGQLVVVYDITGLDGNKGSLTFTDGTPTPWDVDWVGREDANMVVDVEYFDSQWRQGILEGTLSQDHSSITNATFQYWGQVSGTLNGLSGNLIDTEIVDANVDLNPLYGSSARYPTPVNHRDLLPEFDEWNGILPGTMGHGLGDDPTLGGIVPDMSQYDWQVLLGLQPAGLPIISNMTAIIDGSIGEWTSAQMVFDDISGDTEEDPNPIPGMDIDKLYMSYDAQNLYGAITLYGNIDNSINYSYELYLSYSPDDDSALGTLRLKIDVSNGSATSSLWHKDNPNGYPEWISISGSEAVAGTNAVEFKIPLANIPGGLAGRYILLESWGWNPSTSEWHDGEWNETHLKVGGLGTNELGTISGTVSYDDHISGAPIFVQAYIDQWDPEGSVVASTMITAPGAYTLTGIGIGWQGHVRAFTPLFGFNVFDPDALTIEASTSVTLTGPQLTGINLALGEPTTLPDGTWVQGQIDPNTYDEDWYSFNAQQGRVYALDLTRLTSQYATMTLYGRDGDTELEEAWYGGRWQHIDWTCLETGTYYIGVSNGYQSDSGTYQLRIAQQDSMPSGYEVWGGNTNYTSETNWGERYYNIDKQDYVKLGESRDGRSSIFDGDYYTYYVIAVHEHLQVDSVRGIPDGYYSGYLATGNTSNWQNIAGAPDGEYASVGDGYRGGTFRGFVVLTNPGSWTGLTVITSASDTGSLSGQVIDPNDTGLAGARVEIYIGDDENIADEDAWNYYGSTTTDPNGEYRFDLLPHRRYRVRIPDQEVAGTHYFEANLYDVQVLAGSETSNMDPSLRQAGLIYGYVKTSGNTPIPNAWVIAQASWTQKGSGWHNAWTDSNGKYEFWVAPSPGKFYPIWVRSASLDGVSYEWKWDGNFYKAPDPPAETQVPDYFLEPGGTVTGRVLNEDGAGIEGVWVESTWGEAGIGIGFGTWAETDADGNFTLRGLRPGINYVSLENDWREIQQDGVKYMVGEVYAGPLNISSGQTINLDEPFTIYEAGMVTGIVTDESGFPIVGVEMELEGRDIDGNWAYREDEVTDAFGQFTLDYVAPGTYVLWCYKDGFITTVETDIRVDRGEHVDMDVVLKSAAEGAAISGRITNYEDVAAYDSDNSVYYPYYEGSDYDEFGMPWFELLAVDMDRALTEEDYLDPEGKMIIDWFEDVDDGYGDYFEVDVSETPGNYEMTLRAGDIAIGLSIGEEFLPGWGGYVILHDWQRLNLTKGDSVSNLDFTAVTTDTGTLKGDIIVPTGYDYFPESWCLIYAYALDPNGNMETALPGAIAFTGWTAIYEIRNLPAGDYMLKAYARNLASVIVPSVNVASTTIQDITFTSGGTLTGQVTNGTPVSGATVTIVENGKQASTDAEGNYTIAGINTGIYTVNASALGYADAQATVQVTEGSVTTRDFALSATVGSISGTVKDIADANVNGATVAAYNETDNTSKTAETVGGAFSIAGLTPGQYILAVNTDDYGVVVYPTDGSRITLSATQEITGINITVGTLQPPVFTVTSSASDAEPVVLSMEFYADRNLEAVPTVSIVDGNGVLDSLTSNSALNRFNIDYTAVANDNMVRIQIAETTPLVSGSPASKTFTFEVGSNLVATSSTNVTNATGGSTSIMGTQDNTEIYVPPFAIAGADDTQALTLTIERYGDPGDAVAGTDANSVSAVYDFSFDDEGVSIDENHTFTVTMSFQLPEGMTQQEFEDSLVISYFDAGDQVWRIDGISNVRINWANSTIMFEVSHLSKFAAFLGSGVISDFCGANFTEPDGYVDVWDLMWFADRWHKQAGDRDWYARCDLSGADSEVKDGYIDVWDLIVFADNWHEGVKP